MPRIEEWKNRGEIKGLWRYVITSIIVVFSVPITIMVLLAFLTVTLGLTFDEPGVTEVVQQTGLLMRTVHFINLCLMVGFYYFVIQFTRGMAFSYKQWMMVGVTTIPIFYYLFTSA